jgi:ATP-binding cassette subfamily F protein uup
MVSHDRRFLENCVNRIIEVSPSYPTGMFQAEGAYSTFLEKRQEFLDLQNVQEERLANKVRRETEWLRRGPKARTSKARYRIDEAYRLQDELAQVRNLNRADGQIGVDFSSTGRKTRKLLEAHQISKSYAQRALFQELDIILSPGSRVGLIGRNGCGKSTLMNILAAAADGQQWADSGSVSLAPAVAIASFRQDRANLDQKITLRRALAPEGDSVIFNNRSVHVVTWAKRFLFRPDQLETPIGNLSGGEQARILIAELMRQPADILLLDEPTNDLDIHSRDVLEESLLEFLGAIVLVTHDRYLLDRVCSQLLGFTGSGEVFWYGDYRQWLRDMENLESGDDGPAGNSRGPGAPQASRTMRSGRLSYLDQREYDQIEAQIERAELERDGLERRINEPELASDPQQLDEIWRELEKARLQVERLYERWDELEEKRSAGS